MVSCALLGISYEVQVSQTGSFDMSLERQVVFAWQDLYLFEGGAYVTTQGHLSRQPHRSFCVLNCKSQFVGGHGG
jgi:hypothetical protein